MLGQWIDGLTDEQKDRIVRGVSWTTGSYVRSDGSRCLVGIAADVKAQAGGHTFASGAVVHSYPSTQRIRAVEGHTPVFDRFDRLCERFGLDRIVRCVKLRAGASLDDLPQPEREAVGAG